MVNPYESPISQIETEQSKTPGASAALVLTVLYTATFLCWATFWEALDLTFRDMFSGPAPPHTGAVFIAAGLFGATSISAAASYIVRHRHYAASIGGLVAAGVAAAISSLPLVVSVLAFLSEYFNFDL